MSYVQEIVDYYDDGTAIYGPVWQDDPVDDVTQNNLSTSDFWQTAAGPDKIAGTADDEISIADELALIKGKATAGTATAADTEGLLSKITSKFGTAVSDGVKKLLFKTGTNEINTSGLATIGGAIFGLMGGNDKQYASAGYTKHVPVLNATRQQIPYAADPNRRPGEAGRQYFTDIEYTDPSQTLAARTAAKTEAQGIAALDKPRTAQVNPYKDKYVPAWNPAADTKKDAAVVEQQPASGVAQLLPVPDAQGFKPLAGGGLAAGGFVVPADVVAHLGNGSSSAGLALLAEKLNAKPIKGEGDGMSDSIPTHIDGKEKALVANDEAYIEPEMVKQIGSGDTKAGSEKLYAMMERIRRARTGNPEQGKKINPNKFMPGGIAQLAGGGEIRRFVEGGLSSSLSPWAGDTVTNMLGKTEALVNAPQQNYTGPLTAGSSDLQNQAFAGISTVANAGYKPTTYQSGTFDATQAQNYMNPYLSAALTPQLAEMRRQADITRVGDAGRMTQAGAFGGSRQAIMESEGNRNLLDKQTQAIGSGYQTAYDKAMGQFNTEQDRRLNTDKATEASRQYSADYGLKSLNDMASMGATQRGIESEGILADKTQFEENRDRPAAMLQFQKKMLEGLPLSPQKSTESTTLANQIASSVAGGKSVEQALRDLGVI